MRNIMKNKKVVITGGCGFIGANLVYALFKDNEVVVIDDISTGKLENIDELIKNQEITLIKGDIRDLDLLKTTFSNADYIFHLASIPSVIMSIKEPELTNEVNITGTMNVLIAAKENGVKKVIFASSAAVYGNIPTVPLTEDMPPLPDSPYGAQKLGGEHYLRVFYEVYGIATTSLRFFNVFGPKQDPKSEYSPVIPKFITRLVKNTPPVIFGDGNQTRDFIFVEDIVNANILAAENSASNGKSINIACGMETSVNDLAQKIKDILGKDIRAEHIEPKEGEIIRSLADISLAQTLLGFKPKYSLEDGLKVTIEHFDSIN
jgi:UDP-glucose 4-epimerase